MRRALLPGCLLGLIANVVACASAPVKPAAPAFDLVKADALVTEGCYDCLTGALDIYTGAVAVPKLRASVLPRLFETTVLLGMREKELALDASKRFDTAKALIAELPATYGAAAYLDMAIAVLPDQVGAPRRKVAAIKRPSPAQYGEWQTTLQAGADSAEFRRYLSISLDCSFGIGLGTRPAPSPNAAAAPTSPWALMPDAKTDPPGNLLTYRRANCLRIDRVVLSGLAEGDARFLEAGVIVGRTRSMTPTSKEIANGRLWLTSAFAKWPSSPSVTYGLGAFHQAGGDCRSALTFYDKTLALEPLHEAAQLGRLICLSYAKQHAEAIAQAGSMLAANIEEGETRYWRAWNERELGKLVEARADSDRMKQILYNDRAMTLAGQIEYDQDTLEIAEKDLADAARLNPINCIAPWYLGLVQLKRQAWTPTADAFAKAMSCYESAVAYDRAKLAEMQKAENVDESFRASQIAGFEAAIKDDSSQVSASAFNAAVNYARGNNREKALAFCDLAARDPDRVKQAAELRAMIVKSPT